MLTIISLNSYSDGMFNRSFLYPVRLTFICSIECFCCQVCLVNKKDRNPTRKFDLQSFERNMSWYLIYKIPNVWYKINSVEELRR